MISGVVQLVLALGITTMLILLVIYQWERKR